MSDLTPTRSAVIGLKEERRAMHESYVFLDEKCLLLAGAMLRELRRFDSAGLALRAVLTQAGVALAAAVGRHGLEGLQCYPAPSPEGMALDTRWHSLLGVPLVDANARQEKADAPEPFYASAEAQACSRTFLGLTAQLAPMAAMSGNLERLYREYRRSVRKVRALQDVLLPELDRDLHQMETQLEELEQDEALGARWGRVGA